MGLSGGFLKTDRLVKTQYLLVLNLHMCVSSCDLSRPWTKSLRSYDHIFATRWWRPQGRGCMHSIHSRCTAQTRDIRECCVSAEEMGSSGGVSVSVALCTVFSTTRQA